MATFLSGVSIGTWAGYGWTATLTGNVSRSGNTVTLSSLYCSTAAAGASGSDGSIVFMIQNSGGGELTRHTGISMSGGSGGFSFNNVSVDVGASTTSYTFKFYCSDNGVAHNFTVTFPSGVVAPSGGSATVNSSTWNSITATATITSYGTPSSTNGRYVQVLALPSTSSSINDAFASASENNALTTGEKTLSGSSSYALVGCTGYKVGWYANNLSANANGVNSTVYYTPPHPLASMTVEKSNNSYIITATGAAADDTNNASGALVDTEFRVSTDGGSTYSSWTAQATSQAPDTAVDYTIESPSVGTTVVVQARQVYQSQYSEVKETIFTTGQNVYGYVSVRSNYELPDGARVYYKCHNAIIDYINSYTVHVTDDPDTVTEYFEGTVVSAEEVQNKHKMYIKKYKVVFSHDFNITSKFEGYRVDKIYFDFGGVKTDEFSPTYDATLTDVNQEWMFQIVG